MNSLSKVIFNQNRQGFCLQWFIEPAFGYIYQTKTISRRLRLDRRVDLPIISYLGLLLAVGLKDES